MKSLKNDYISYLLNRFPGIGSLDQLNSLISENLLSPFVLKLPEDILKQAQSFVTSAFRLRESSGYKEFMSDALKVRNIVDPGNKSIVMSYDFHLSSDGQLKLIEINTNASFLALGDAMYYTHGISQPVSGFSLDEVRENILEELDLFGQPNTRPDIAILDERPQEQKLFAEFLLYKEWMNEWGFQPSIKDISEISGNEDFIYNRHTDFYLQEPRSKKLLEFFQLKRICFSPNPYEYFMLADKQRLIEWSRMNLDGALLHHLPSCQELRGDNSEEIWAHRKKFFFKPLRSFGAKHSFRGASISRKAFDELIGHGIIAQEFVPAPERIFESPEGPQSYKFDLRFYAYRDRVQSAVARIYQGQVTNLRTIHGGFSPIIFEKMTST